MIASVSTKGVVLRHKVLSCAFASFTKSSNKNARVVTSQHMAQQYFVASTQELRTSTRSFSTQPKESESSNNSESVNPVSPDEFEFPRARDLYQRIVAELKTKEEIDQLGEHTLSLLGRTFRENEFYYRSFGGKKVGGRSGAGDNDEEEKAAAEPAKTIFDLKLCSFDAKSKIKVIKEVRALAGLGLKEAKDLVESTLPKVIMKGVSKEQGDEFIKTLQAVGAEMELS